MVEAAMVLGIFMLGLLAGCDLLRVSFFYLTAQHAVQTTTRWATAADAGPGNNRVQIIKTELRRKAEVFGIEFDTRNIWVCPTSSPTRCMFEDAGSPRTDFSISVRYPVHLITLNREITLDFLAYGRNERS